MLLWFILGLIVRSAAVHSHGRTDPEDTRVCCCKSYKPGQEVLNQLLTELIFSVCIYFSIIYQLSSLGKVSCPTARRLVL